MTSTPNNLIPTLFFTSLPGPSRKRAPTPYRYRVLHQHPNPAEPGCILLWEVLGGREPYQIALERLPSGKLRWHCSCADAIFRGENSPHLCKHVRGLQSMGRG